MGARFGILVRPTAPLLLTDRGSPASVRARVFRPTDAAAQSVALAWDKAALGARLPILPGQTISFAVAVTAKAGWYVRETA